MLRFSDSDAGRPRAPTPPQVDALRAELSGWALGLHAEMALLRAASEAREREAARREGMLEGLLAQLGGAVAAGHRLPLAAVASGRALAELQPDSDTRAEKGSMDLHC